MTYDSHIHLARLPHYRALLGRLREVGCRFTSIACEPWEWKETEELRDSSPELMEGCGFAFGIHPMIATQVGQGELDQLKEILRSGEGLMVGEAGLDKRYPGYEVGGPQEEIFKWQGRLALELKRDLQIHVVGDYQRVLSLLMEIGYKAQGKAGPRLIFHRFGGDGNLVKKALELNSYFSLHIDSFRKKSAEAALKMIPKERVLFETDADESFFKNEVSVENESEQILDRLKQVESLYRKIKD